MKTNHHTRVPRLLIASFFALALIIQALPIQTASAAQISNRRVTLQAGATDGGTKPGGVVNHFFEFTLPAGNSVGSIKFQYCTTAAAVVGGLDCNVPTGLNTSSATIGSQTGATGFVNINTTTNGAPYISRLSASPVAANQPVTYQLRGITNPTTTNQTFHIRISTYASLDATGTPLDTGTVTTATATPIELSGTMPESLVFCTGHTVSTTSGVPDCATADSGVIGFNQLFSPTDTATATSQMAASTNAGAGYAITVNGTTLTSGANTITAMSGTGNTSTTGIRGTSQFGINLKANTITTSNPAIGAEVGPIADGTRYNGRAYPNYNTVDAFKFASGDVVADSNSAGTDAQIFTASYVVNVPGNQPAGTYSTTLTYICTPTF